MASFAEFIAESYYSNVDLIWNLAGATRAIASFEINGMTITVNFEQREPAAAWHASFDVRKGEPVQAVHSSFAIFNGVFQAVREFITVRQPELLVFATKQESLANIYQTYLRRENSTIEKLGYRLEGPQRVEPFIEYTLRRIAQSEWRNN